MATEYPEKITHDELIELGRKWLIKPYASAADYGHTGCTVVLTEIVCNTWGGEQPDVLGFTSSRCRSILIECKTSRSDFRADKKKPFRASPEFGLGLQRWFLAPLGVIPTDELPENWGLLEVDKNKIKVTKRAEVQERNYQSEIKILLSTMCRLNILPDNHIAIRKYEPLEGLAPSKNRATFYITEVNEMTRRTLIFIDEAGQSFITPEFNGDKEEFEQFGSADSCDKKWVEIEAGFQNVKTLEEFKAANAIAQRYYHSSIAGQSILPVVKTDTAIPVDVRKINENVLIKE
jgi:hypothetical protein